MEDAVAAAGAVLSGDPAGICGGGEEAGRAKLADRRRPKRRQVVADESSGGPVAVPHLSDLFLAIAAIPFIYYFIAIYSSWRYFRQPVSVPPMEPGDSFTPPVSVLKPIRGLDPDAAENLASFCRLDYAEYEIVFCVDADDEAVLSVLAKLTNDFPQCRIRILYGSGRVATNDKVAKLARLVNEAAHEMVVIRDSDGRVC